MSVDILEGFQACGIDDNIRNEDDSVPDPSGG